jgi:hypothetical protein
MVQLHFSYPMGVLLIYSLVAAVGFVCNISVIASIVRRPMNTPNVRFVLIMIVTLFFEQIASFPQIYVKYGYLCSAAGALETYLQMLMLGTGTCMAVLTYYQLFRGDDTWYWLNSRRVYAAIFLCPLCGMLPLFDRSGYTVYEGVWCAALTDSKLGRNWVIVNFVYAYATIGAMTIIFAVILYRLRKQDVRIVQNVHYGVGGYVMITILVWLTRILLSWHKRRATALAVHLLPDISAVFYAMLYFRRRDLLYKFEQAVTGLVSPSVEWSLSFQFNRSTIGNLSTIDRDSDSDFTTNPVVVSKAVDTMLMQLKQKHVENGIVLIQRGTDVSDIESNSTTTQVGVPMGISSVDMTVDLN